MATLTLFPSVGAQTAHLEGISWGLLDCENFDCLPFPLSGGCYFLSVYPQTLEQADEFVLCILLFLAIDFYCQVGERREVDDWSGIN